MYNKIEKFNVKLIDAVERGFYNEKQDRDLCTDGLPLHRGGTIARVCGFHVCVTAGTAYEIR